MNSIEKSAVDFLSSQSYAVVGVSTRRPGAANAVYAALLKRGVIVLPVNPKIEKYDDRPCYPNLESLPQKVEAVVVVTGPGVAEEIARQAVRTGVKKIWFHSAFGTTPRLGKEAALRQGSVSDGALRICRQAGMAVIPGACPMMFIGDAGHRMMRRFLRWTGALEVPEEKA